MTLICVEKECPYYGDDEMCSQCHSGISSKPSEARDSGEVVGGHLAPKAATSEAQAERMPRRAAAAKASAASFSDCEHRRIMVIERTVCADCKKVLADILKQAWDTGITKVKE